MKHAREDYNRIQDPEGLIHEDEPVFLLRGQDVLAPTVVELWALAAELRGADTQMVTAARNQAKAMKEWQLAQIVKIPDVKKNIQHLTQIKRSSIMTNNYVSKEQLDNLTYSIIEDIINASDEETVNEALEDLNDEVAVRQEFLN